MMTSSSNETQFVESCVIIVLLCVSIGTAQTDTDFEKASAEFKAGNYVSASALFARVETNSAGTTQALLYQAKCLVQLQDFSGGETVLRRYLSAHGNDSDALYLLGFVLNRQNRPSDSLKVYTQAAAVALPTGDDLKIVGLDYVLLDDYPDAIRWLEKAVERDSQNEDAWYYLGRAYYTKARLADARNAFQKVLAINPNSSKAENNLGLILESEGNLAGALNAYRTAIAWQERSLHPNEQPFVNLGNLLMEQGQTKEAITALTKAVELEPNSAQCHMTLGMALRQSAKFEGARKELEKAAQLAPDNANAHYQLGRLYKDIHATALAQSEFSKTDELKARSAGSKIGMPKPE
jgi:tetratricopeptide (TPR) repeat protein